jgi:hypothetical protein
MPPDIEPVQNTLNGLAQIEVSKGHRNMFAHFAVRQVPGHDALVFVCKDNKDFKMAHGMEIPELGILFSIMDVKNINVLAEVVRGCESWFAHKTTEWAARYPKVV